MSELGLFLLPEAERYIGTFQGWQRVRTPNTGKSLVSYSRGRGTQQRLLHPALVQRTVLYLDQSRRKDDGSYWWHSAHCLANLPGASQMTFNLECVERPVALVTVLSTLYLGNTKRLIKEGLTAFFSPGLSEG